MWQIAMMIRCNLMSFWHMLRSEEDVPIIASATIAGIQTPMKVKSEHSENGVLKQLLMAEQQLPQHSSNCLQQSLQQLVMLSQHLPHPLQQIIMNYRLKQLWHFYISLDNIAFSIYTNLLYFCSA